MPITHMCRSCQPKGFGRTVICCGILRLSMAIFLLVLLIEFIGVKLRQNLLRLVTPFLSVMVTLY